MKFNESKLQKMVSRVYDKKTELKVFITRIDSYNSETITEK